MTMHNISLEDGVPAEDAGSGGMDDVSLRKLEAAARQPVRARVRLFRPGTTLPVAGPVAGLPVPVQPTPPDPVRAWNALTPVELDPARLARNGLFLRSGTDPAVAAFDILRTRTLLAMRDNGWQRIAVTSPTHGCGKSLVAANLALSFARRPDCRTVLIDLDLRRPGLAALFALRETEPLRDMLTGAQPAEQHLLRASPTLALGLNGSPVEDPSTLLQSHDIAGVIAAMTETLAPGAILFDLPPALVTDDVIALLPQVDAVLLVADGTRTTAAEVVSCERLFGGRVPLLGVVLNRAQDLSLTRYRYGRGKR